MTNHKSDGKWYCDVLFLVPICVWFGLILVLPNEEYISIAIILNGEKVIWRNITWAINTAGNHWCRIDPHGEKCKPWKKLNYGKLLHGWRHSVEIIHYCNKSIFVLPAFLQESGNDHHNPESHCPEGQNMQLFF